MDIKEKDEEFNWRSSIRTILAGAGGMSLLVFIGVNEAQSSMILPQLREKSSSIRVTPDEETWIATLGIVMAPISAIIFGPFIDTFGRKKSLQIFYFNAGIGYAVMACAREVYQIYIGRIICGIGLGQLACGIVYVVEICTKKQREFFLASTGALIASGVTLASVITGYLPWQLASLIYSISAFIFFITQCFIPESPAWLYKMGRADAAILSLKTLGRRESNIRRELKIYEYQCEDDQKELKLRTFLSPTVWKPFFIMTCFLFFVPATGIVDLLYYSVDFIQRLRTLYDPVLVAVILPTTRFFACCGVAVFLRGKLGRKSSVAFSNFGMAVAFLGLGVYEYINRNVSTSKRPFQWLPIVSLLIYMATSVVGMLGLPWGMCGEVYPLKVRGIMTSVSYAIGFCFYCIFIKSYKICVDVLQIHGLLFAFAGFSFIAVFFAVFVLPETQNKSLFEIEQAFTPKSKRQLHKRKPEISVVKIATSPAMIDSSDIINSSDIITSVTFPSARRRSRLG